MMNNPMVDQLMGQLVDNPELFNAYMNNPVIKSQLE